jgi:mannosyltransferase OCH1-like enzyme
MEKIIHQIWVGPYEMPDMEKYFVTHLKELNPDFEHILWTDKNLPPLPDLVKQKVDYWLSQETYAFAADVLRVFLIHEYGGIYLDVDWYCTKGFSDLNLENYDGLIIYHSEYTTGNEIFGSSAKKGLIEGVYNRMLATGVTENHMPYWFNHVLKEHLQVEDTWNHIGHPHQMSQPKTQKDINEFERLGKEWLDVMKSQNILALKKWGEFENVYAAHRQLHSWDPKHKEDFKKGNINYKDEYCFIKGYNK